MTEDIGGPLKGNGERVLDRKKMAIVGIVEACAKQEFRCSYYRLKPADEVRLLRLAQLEEKYKVPASWILKVLVPIWQGVRKTRGGSGLGITISTLVGKKSEEILKQQIESTFPDGENYRRARSREQERQWRMVQEEDGATSNLRMDWKAPREAIEKYKSRVRAERQGRARWAEQALRKPYRGNPWI